jgi:hypothetical protein
MDPDLEDYLCLNGIDLTLGFLLKLILFSSKLFKSIGNL